MILLTPTSEAQRYDAQMTASKQARLDSPRLWIYIISPVGPCAFELRVLCCVQLKHDGCEHEARAECWSVLVTYVSFPNCKSC